MIILVALLCPVASKADTALFDRIEEGIDYSDYAKVDASLNLLRQHNKSALKALPRRFKELAEYVLRERMERVNMRDCLAATLGSVISIVSLGRCAYHYFPREYTLPSGVFVRDTSRSSSQLAIWSCALVAGVYWTMKGLKESYKHASIVNAHKIKQRMYTLCMEQNIPSIVRTP